jgi:hypothetical protein
LLGYVNRYSTKFDRKNNPFKAHIPTISVATFIPRLMKNIPTFLNLMNSSSMIFAGLNEPSLLNQFIAGNSADSKHNPHRLNIVILNSKTVSFKCRKEHQDKVSSTGCRHD